MKPLTFLFIVALAVLVVLPLPGCAIFDPPPGKYLGGGQWQCPGENERTCKNLSAEYSDLHSTEMERAIEDAQRGAPH